MDIYVKIGRKLKDLRETEGLKQSEVADKVGLTRSSIANIEQGRQKIQIDTLYDLAYLYKVSPIELLPTFSELSEYEEQQEAIEEKDKNKILSIVNRIREREDYES
jgi:transcriptional regulator with XRE-family HTH domain